VGKEENRGGKKDGGGKSMFGKESVRCQKSVFGKEPLCR